MSALHKDVFSYATVSRVILPRIRNVSNKLVQQIKRILYSKIFSKNCVNDELNVEKYSGAKEATDKI
jgi:hypothetical protein